jgi:hypothetical protein
MGRIIALDGDQVVFERLSDLSRSLFYLCQVHEDDVNRLRPGVLVVLHNDGFVEQAEASISRMIGEIA